MTKGELVAAVQKGCDCGCDLSKRAIEGIALISQAGSRKNQNTVKTAMDGSFRNLVLSHVEGF